MLMKERDQIMASFYKKQILDALLNLKRMPYLPFRGEIFDALQHLRKIAEENQQDITIFDIHPTGQLIYCIEKQKFTALVPEVHLSISMTSEECIDSLLMNRFSPFPSKKEKMPTSP